MKQKDTDAEQGGRHSSRAQLASPAPDVCSAEHMLP